MSSELINNSLRLLLLKNSLIFLICMASQLKIVNSTSNYSTNVQSLVDSVPEDVRILTIGIGEQVNEIEASLSSTSKMVTNLTPTTTTTITTEASLTNVTTTTITTTTSTPSTTTAKILSSTMTMTTPQVPTTKATTMNTTIVTTPLTTKDTTTVTYSSTTTRPFETATIADGREDLEFWEAPIEIQKNFPYYLSGYDSDRRPIWVIEGGRWNVRSIVEQGEEAMKNFEKFALQGFFRGELSINRSSTPDWPVTNDIIILDFEDLNLWQIAHVPTVKFLLHLAGEIRYFLLNYLHLALVINTNAVAHTLINLVRPIFARAFEHVELYGTNKARWIPQILKHCPRDQVPSWYGGSNKNFKPLMVYG